MGQPGGRGALEAIVAETLDVACAEQMDPATRVLRTLRDLVRLVDSAATIDPPPPS